MYNGSYENIYWDTNLNLPEPQQDEVFITPPKFSRYKSHPGFGQRGGTTPNRALIKKARKANRLQRKR